MTININQTIVYDESIILKIKEMIEAGLNKLKSFVKGIKDDNLNFYNDLSDRFNQIALKLEELELWDELNYFLSISQFIEYIIHQNCLDSSFGHCDFAVELLKFFIEYIKVNFDYYLNKSYLSLEEFEAFQEEIQIKHYNYLKDFFREICEFSGDYSQEELYEIHTSLR
ncbi:hypothetical protein [Methanobrevibacter sp.]|uniref:hypothetical protein n=1 Tax=Methanobrevibacter sp. TaxID=66852 RepID=UPI00388EC27F